MGVVMALALGTAPAQAAAGSFAVSVPGGELAGRVAWNASTATVDAVVVGHRQDRWTTAIVLAYSGDTQVGAWTQGVLREAKEFSVELGEPGVVVSRVTAQVCAPVGQTRERCSSVKELHRR